MSAGPAALVVACALAYAVGVRRVRGWPVARTLAFAAGVLALAVAFAEPLDARAHERLSAHMAQHMLLLLVAPLGLAAGAPVRLALAASCSRTRRRLARLLHALPLTPLSGWVVFTVVLLTTHLEPVYELALRDPAVHALVHVVSLAAGFALWAPLLAVDPLPHRPGAAARFAWLLAAMPPMGVLGAVLLRGTVAYPSYPDLADQRAAAGLMWGAGSLLLAAALVAIVFSALLHEERRQRRREAAL